MIKKILKIKDKNYRYRKIIQFASKNRFLSKTKIVKEMQLYLGIINEYYNRYNRYPNLTYPSDLNEKLLWLSFYWRNPLKSRCADKYLCRDYATNVCGLPENLLVPLLGVWDTAEDIDFDALPNQFVLKCNHGCGYNIIVNDKSALDTIQTKKQLNQWLSENFAGNVSEIHYRDINPHKIICEKYLPAIGDDTSVIDYKLMCFNGSPSFILVCHNRDENGEPKLATFSHSWEQLFYTKNEKKIDLSKPASLNKMIEYAHVLSKDFPFVRVDFYDVAGKPLFGEMTFTPYGNILTYFTPDVIAKYGKILQLPQKYKNKSKWGSKYFQS